MSAQLRDTPASRPNTPRSARRRSNGQWAPIHGGAGTATYRSWNSMIERCFNPRHHAYARYGGKGITVCAEWRDSFEAFLRDVGQRPDGMTLDRIDNTRGYEPGNVRWADWVTQQRNRSDTHHLTHEGRTQCITAWASEIGMSPQALRRRLNAGWSLERALVTPRATKWLRK